MKLKIVTIYDASDLVFTTLFNRNVIIYGENGSENTLLRMFNDFFLFILCSRKDLEKQHNPKQ